ncbi:hypothetical protein NM208_g4713 [Fusarium decemcellulare]|uniref:Uncharacterized protein n=1 Tax=Fusarium decemcellulare TaxID=57161 RepID=A0ACC1SJZ6_9HYPO|nr:hypothetical protein NM208_g4713 [Fusarium decemcellulare]
MSWKTIAKEHRAAVLQSIPERWRLDNDQYRSLKDVTSVPYTSGILTEAQLKTTELTVVELVKRLESRELKAVQVLEAFAARTAITHQLLNCLTDWFYEDALQQAKDLDQALEKGGKLKGPLHGIPIALKVRYAYIQIQHPMLIIQDIHCVKGRASTGACISDRNFVPENDSNIVGALRAAGAVFFCKTTMPQTAMALETVSNLWGRTLNPFNTDLGAGGSSGGDAVLVAMKGTPITLSTDLGGSVRVPAAFNGLYGIRPTASRIPKGGMVNFNTGQITINLSCGPICRSIDDLELFTKVINAHPNNRYDVTCTPVPWRMVDTPERKLTFGVMKWDGVVMPHPPVLRALEHTKQTLEKAGHEVIPFDVPFDCWSASQTTASSNLSDGYCSSDKSSEPLIPAFADLLKVYKPREHTAAEALQLNIKAKAFKEQFLTAWNVTASRTASGHPIDALILPPAPAVAYPHDFNIYWGYTALFNLLDYPATILPIPDFKITAEQDPVDSEYRPQGTNPYDKPNHDLYDPTLYLNQPSTIQVVGRPFEDEELIQVSSIIDKLFRGL